MLPSLSAGTFECGRPQIVFERRIVIVVVIEPKALRVMDNKKPDRSTSGQAFLSLKGADCQWLG